jgi:hypothetical protein
MTLPGMVVVFIIILVLLSMAGYPIPPILVRAIYAMIIVLLIVIGLQALGTPRPRTCDAHHTLTGTGTYGT